MTLSLKQGSVLIARTLSPKSFPAAAVLPHFASRSSVHLGVAFGQSRVSLVFAPFTSQAHEHTDPGGVAGVGEPGVHAACNVSKLYPAAGGERHRRKDVVAISQIYEKLPNFKDFARHRPVNGFSLVRTVAPRMAAKASTEFAYGLPGNGNILTSTRTVRGAGTNQSTAH